MKFGYRFLAQFKTENLNNDRGTSSIEYSLLASIIAFVMIVVVAQAGSLATLSFELVGEKMAIAGGGSVSSSATDDMGGNDPE